MEREWGPERSLALDRLDLGTLCATDQMRGPEAVPCSPSLRSLTRKAGTGKFISESIVGIRVEHLAHVMYMLSMSGIELKMMITMIVIPG